MMTKKFLLGLGLCSLLAFPAVNAQAEIQGFCSNGEVISAGASGTVAAVQIRNTRGDCGTWTQGTSRTFILDDAGGKGNAMLAAALAAQAAGSPVLIISQNANYANGSTLTLIYSQSEVQP